MLKDVGMAVPKSRETSTVYIYIYIYAATQGMRAVYLYAAKQGMRAVYAARQGRGMRACNNNNMRNPTIREMWGGRGGTHVIIVPQESTQNKKMLMTDT